jgi:hypothetical protein
MQAALKVEPRLQRKKHEMKARKNKERKENEGNK